MQKPIDRNTKEYHKNKKVLIYVKNVWYRKRIKKEQKLRKNEKIEKP